MLEELLLSDSMVGRSRVANFCLQGSWHCPRLSRLVVHVREGLFNNLDDQVFLHCLADCLSRLPTCEVIIDQGNALPPAPRAAPADWTTRQPDEPLQSWLAALQSQPRGPRVELLSAAAAAAGRVVPQAPWVLEALSTLRDLATAADA